MCGIVGNIVNFDKYKQEKFIWGFGHDKKSKNIYIAPYGLELEILMEQVEIL